MHLLREFYLHISQKIGRELMALSRPHTLPPEMLVQGHVGGVLNSQQSQLNAKLQTAQSQNAMMRDRMEEQRKEIEVLIGSLDVVVRDLEGAGTLVGNEGDTLAAGSREAEGAIGDVKMGES
jgi:kinetochore protein NNF1